MNDRVFNILIGMLVRNPEYLDLEVVKNDKRYLVLKSFNFYLIIPKKTHIDYVKVYFVDIRTHKIVEVYKTKNMFYISVYHKIRRLIKKLNYLYIEQY